MVLKLFSGSSLKLLNNLRRQRIIVAQLEKIFPIVVVVRRNFYAVAPVVVIVFAYPKLNRLCYVSKVIKTAVHKLLV